MADSCNKSTRSQGFEQNNTFFIFWINVSTTNFNLNLDEVYVLLWFLQFCLAYSPMIVVQKIKENEKHWRMHSCMQIFIFKKILGKPYNK